MKKSSITLTILLIIMTLTVNAQNPDVKSRPFPFAKYNEPKLALITQIANPEGYTRYAENRLTPFQLWLSNIPLMPRGSYRVDWRGKKLAEPDTINSIVDMKIDSKYMTDADIPVMLLMNFFHLSGQLQQFNIRLSENLVVNYKEWLSGRYIDDKDKGLYFRDEGIGRADTKEEFDGFVAFVTKYFDNKTLRLNVEHTDDRVALPSHIFIQFKNDDPDSIGHTAVVLDVAMAKEKDRKFIVAYGGNPAQTVIVPNSGKSMESKWFTIDSLREYLKEYGMGYMYRWKNG